MSGVPCRAPASKRRVILLDSDRSHLVLIGGRSGVGKTSVAAEMHAILCKSDVKHAVIEGDALDLAWPAPWQHRLAERNLAAIWSNYRELGYKRLIYTNIMSVLEQEKLASAMGDDPLVTAVLLQCQDTSARERLEQREVGSELLLHIGRSVTRAKELERSASKSVIRIPTDGRSVAGVAGEIIELTGWIPAADEG